MKLSDVLLELAEEEGTLDLEKFVESRNEAVLNVQHSTSVSIEKKLGLVRSTKYDSCRVYMNETVLRHEEADSDTDLESVIALSGEVWNKAIYTSCLKVDISRACSVLSPLDMNVECSLGRDKLSTLELMDAFESPSKPFTLEMFSDMDFTQEASYTLERSPHATSSCSSLDIFLVSKSFVCECAVQPRLERSVCIQL